MLQLQKLFAMSSTTLGIPTETTPANKKTENNYPSVSNRMSRRKSLDSANILDTNLKRCLTTFDITLLAVGHMIGSGVYVLTATVAKNIAGPAIVLSFLLSGVASFLSALCYAELGVRYPKAGSAYSYTYLALGEIWAFMVGWNMALEYVIGAAATARACSAYIDSLTGGVIKSAIVNGTRPVSEAFSIEYLDFFAFGILTVLVIALSFGVKITSYLNNVFSFVNLAVIAVIISAGSFSSDLNNWTNIETGGFMPFGFSGVLAASASCFYAFVGFDSIASASEEANAPQKAIPRATLISMAIASISYVGVSTVLTLMVNYKDISGDSGLPDAFAFYGLHWVKILVIIGAVSGMTTAIVATIFALTRVVYGMAEDGLLLPFCSRVSSKSKQPLHTMYLFSFFAGIMTICLDINSLVEVLSIGALLAYIVVSFSVIVLRYRPPLIIKPLTRELYIIDENLQSSFVENQPGHIKLKFQFLNKFRLFGKNTLLNALILFLLSTIVLCGFCRACMDSVISGCWWAVLILVSLIVVFSVSFLIVCLYQQSNENLRYKVPLVPFVPALSILINTILLVNLRLLTYVRLLIWVVIGLAIYFMYGIEHSKLDVASRILKSWSSDGIELENRTKTIFKTKKSERSTSLSGQFLFASEDPSA